MVTSTVCTSSLPPEMWMRRTMIGRGGANIDAAKNSCSNFKQDASVPPPAKTCTATLLVDNSKSFTRLSCPQEVDKPVLWLHQMICFTDWCPLLVPHTINGLQWSFQSSI